MENDNFTLSEEINGPVLAAAIGLEAVVGLITNSFVLILTLCHLKTWKQPSNIFLTNMILNNLIISVSLMPLSVITCATGEWIFGSTETQKNIVCQVTAYVFLYYLVVETVSFVLISLDRFFFIVKSFQYEKHMTTAKAVIIVAVSWLLAAVLSTPPFYGLGKFEFSESYGVCVPGFEGSVSFSIYLFTVLFGFIATIVVTSTWTFCYTRNYINRKKARTNFRNSIYVSQKRKLVGLFGILVVIHVLCYIPMVILAAIGSFIPLSARYYAAAFFMLLLMTNLSPLAQSYFRYEVRNFIHNIIVKVLRLHNTTLISQENITPPELNGIKK